MFVDVVVNRPTHRRPPAGSEPLRDDGELPDSLTYRLPERLRDRVSVGHLVQVPLQAGTAMGVVVRVADALPRDLPSEAVREVGELLDPMPVLTPLQIDLARWIAGEYLAPLSQAIRLMLPPGLEERVKVVVQRTAASAQDLAPELVTALRWLEQQAERSQLSSLIDRCPVADAEAVLQALAERGLIEIRTTFVPAQPAPPRVQWVSLLADDRTIRSTLPRLGRVSKQADILLALGHRAEAPLTLPELCAQVGCGEEPVRALAERGWVEISRARTLVMALSSSPARHQVVGAQHAAPVQNTGHAQRLSAKQSALLAALREHGGPVEIRALLHETGRTMATVVRLEKKGLVRRIEEPPLVLMCLPAGQVLEKVLQLRGGQTERAVLEALRGARGRVWVGGLYAQTGADLTVLHRLAERGLIGLHSEEVDRPRLAQAQSRWALTPEQEAVWQQVEPGLWWLERGDRPFAALLHGVTGSGKTEIYLRAIETVLAAGQKAIVLVPEISLTAQTVRRFEGRFPGRVAVVHSQLSLGQRYAVWNGQRRGEFDVLIGPRSALLAPVSRLGLIVVDEAHDESYKQDEPIPLPAYCARDAALALGRLAGAAVLFGTATPDLVTYYHSTQGRLHLLELPHRIQTVGVGQGRLAPEGLGDASLRVPSAVRRPPLQGSPRTWRPAPLPPVQIIDLRQELRADNRSIFSRALQQGLRTTLAAGEQAILLLNRRGTATFVLCRDCGYVAQCPRCNLPLTLHRLGSGGKASHLVCHHCNLRQETPARCPECGGSHIRHFGLGTEQVEARLHELCPEARILRWDADTATGPSHERFLQTFIDHRADVLVGTQMIAKGLDLPLVTLVGVVSADTALFLPDYRAAERTFQLLTQVAGRAGRSERGGKVIVQTYQPEHHAIRAAAAHDYATFYARELECRRQLGYPPFSRLLALRLSDEDGNRCQSEAERLARWLAAEIRRLSAPAEIIGPAPCFFSRIRGRARWQIVLRGPDPAGLLRGVSLPWGWRVDVDPVSLL